jgi:hypothetical protein
MNESEMPKYKEKKRKKKGGEVHALKIKKVVAARPAGAPYNRRQIEVEEDGFAPVIVDHLFMAAKPKPGDYIVVGEDGAQSCMKGSEFEEKYKALG